jgi:hypothetical protein
VEKTLIGVKIDRWPVPCSTRRDLALAKMANARIVDDFAAGMLKFFMAVSKPEVADPVPLMEAALADWSAALAQPENELYHASFPFVPWLQSKLEGSSLQDILRRDRDEKLAHKTKNTQI